MSLNVTVHETYDYMVREYPDFPFTRYNGREITFAQASARANRLANALIAAGCGKGERLAVLSKNSDEMAIIFLAASRCGAVPVAINYRLAPQEWAYIVNDSQARVLIGRNDDLVQALDTVRDTLACQVLLADNCVAPDGWSSYDEFLSSSTTEQPQVNISPEDTFYQLYTSGTTGHPKGVEITNANIVAYTQQCTQSLPYRVSPGDSVLVVVPMYHAAGALTSISTHMGGGCLAIHEDANPAEIVRAMDEDGVVATSLVPALIQFCLGVEGIASRRFEKLRFISYGASAIAPHTLSQALETFGCDFLQGFGMTETTAATTMLLAPDHVRALNGRPELLKSAGRPMIGSQIRIVDEQRQPVATGTIGEIALKGPQVMKGYWNLPEKTAETLVDGWIYTGDAGRLDEEGYLYIEDRIKDMVISGGENIYPREVENILIEHPQILDVAVIGIPDDKWGEVPMGILVCADGTAPDPDELIAFCRKRTAGYKIPRRFAFIDILPRNPSGKILKTVLRKQFHPKTTIGTSA
ncbi:MAG: acyl-CoA synthetase (AMP-forming)/AMP-acid ligase II [Bermanella sp.]|jgi:acyl-CoA synthetase (AMP-forming)/AMP-acid ligase II